MAQLIVFDLDGTILDARRDLAGAVNHIRGTMNLEPSDAERFVRCIGNGINSPVRRCVADMDVDAEEAVKRFQKFYPDYLCESVTLCPGVFSGIKELAASGTKLAVCSNKSTEICRKHLDYFSLTPFFADILGGDALYPMKPAPDALLALQEKYGFAKSGCWIAGDSAIDLEAGRRAGFRRIFFSCGIGTAEPETPDYTVNSFAEFLNVIRGF